MLREFKIAVARGVCGAMIGAVWGWFFWPTGVPILMGVGFIAGVVWL
jgi:hypothetical protein